MMKNFYFKRHAISTACLHFVALAFALNTQTTFAQNSQTMLESVIVTGEANQSESLTKPFSLIPSTALKQTGASSLGEALRNQPGMSATGFGPNASRPIVRGQDSDRIKILRNSAATVDVSALSFDHALPVDPFSLQQVEVLRGPAALAYGGNAVGGVVNLIDRRIAREAVTGFQGEVNVLVGTADEQTASGFKMDAGLGQRLSLHLDGFKRNTRDLKTPTFTDPDGFRGNRVKNSSAKTEGVALGVSVQTGNGHVGVSTERYENDYGVPKSQDVRIGMDSKRHALEGEQRFANAAFQSLKYRLAKTDYGHQEFEGGQPNTQFINQGKDGRLELALQRFKLAQYEIQTHTGVQFERTRFSAIGEEAFVPATNTTQTGWFGIFRAHRGKDESGQFELGLRTDQLDVNAASSGTSPEDGPVAGNGVNTGPALERSFAPRSLSLGYEQSLGGGWSLGVSLSRVERAPSSFELYADGVHVATNAYEKGNPNLQKERGRHVEISSKWGQGDEKFSATAFVSRYSNYITLTGRTGNNNTFTNTDGNGNPVDLQVFDFTAVPAEFRGIEWMYQTRYKLGAGHLQPAIQYDLVRGKETNGGANLPRISPQRIVTRLTYAQQGWSFAPELVWMDKSKASRGDVFTPGYHLINLRIAKSFNSNNTGGEVFATLYNLSNELAFSATTLNTVRGYTPLAGRSALMGVEFLF